MRYERRILQSYMRRESQSRRRHQLRIEPLGRLCLERRFAILARMPCRTNAESISGTQELAGNAAAATSCGSSRCV
jgi:hypothetical protein